MARYRLCYKVKATNKVVEGDYVIGELEVDKYRVYVDQQNANQTKLVFSLEKEPSKLPKTRKPYATMAKRKKGD